MPTEKSWWLSKTIWVNALALIGSCLIAQGMNEASWTEIATVTLAVVNLILRFLTTDRLVTGAAG